MSEAQEQETESTKELVKYARENNAVSVFAFIGGMSSGKRPLAEQLFYQFRAQGYDVINLSELNFTSDDGYVNSADDAKFAMRDWPILSYRNIVIMHFADRRSVDYCLEAMRSRGDKHDVHYLEVSRIQH